MQLSILAIALSIGAVSAHNCQVGLRYCAYNLIGKGMKPWINFQRCS